MSTLQKEHARLVDIDGDSLELSTQGTGKVYLTNISRHGGGICVSLSVHQARDLVRALALATEEAADEGQELDEALLAEMAAAERAS